MSKWDKWLEANGLLKYQTDKLTNAQIQQRYKGAGLNVDWKSLGRDEPQQAPPPRQKLAQPDEGQASVNAQHPASQPSPGPMGQGLVNGEYFPFPRAWSNAITNYLQRGPNTVSFHYPGTNIYPGPMGAGTASGSYPEAGTIPEKKVYPQSPYFPLPPPTWFSAFTSYLRRGPSTAVPGYQGTTTLNPTGYNKRPVTPANPVSPDYYPTAAQAKYVVPFGELRHEGLPDLGVKPGQFGVSINGYPMMPLNPALQPPAPPPPAYGGWQRRGGGGGGGGRGYRPSQASSDVLPNLGLVNWSF
ncbi:MAG TPA: hypothetical protein VHM28_00220 [Anaerolineales bacterium]|jgi:hypothetical protein|nr:hypothetical protein [Anaerolineales bacterium]